MDLSQDWATGRTALVTGATSGFGAAFARRVLAAGGKVIAAGRRAERLAALADPRWDARLFTLALDVTEPDCGDRLLAALPVDFEGIDTLFNNAGLSLGMDPAQDSNLADWEQMIATNISGLVRITRAVLPGMVTRGRGHVVNVGSVAANWPYRGGNVYGATKAFVKQFSLNLRTDLLGTPVKVTVLEPGACETEFSMVRFGGDEAKAAAVYADMKPLSAEDVVDSVEAVLRLPAHLNVNVLEIMPVQQAFGGFAIDRSGADGPGTK